MTERLSDISARIGGIRQLGAVVNAMRGIAAARAQQARTQTEAVESYAAIIAAAIGRALTLIPAADVAAHTDGRRALVVFGAEQGFAGAFSERMLDALGDERGRVELYLVGTRGVSVAHERGMTPAWTGAAPTQSTGAPKLADQIAEALYPKIANGEIEALDVMFTRWRPGQAPLVERRRLFPLDVEAFRGPASGQAPLLDLSPAALLNALTADYLHAQLCDAALHAFAAENEARMEAMAAARRQIDRQLADLQATERRVRQEEITSEILELAAGEAASQHR
jgi:F-type H+-transporting ATPase subunit gamma